MCRVIVFDLDGTLVDSVDAHIEAWKRAMKDLGKEVTKEEEEMYRKNVGKTLRDILRAIYGDVDESFVEEIKKRKTKYFFEVVDRIRPIIEPRVLRELAKRNVLALFTSTTKENAEKMLNHLGVSDLFSVIVTADDVSKPKPDPEGLLKIAEMTGCDDIVFVGDTVYDEEAARRAGAKFYYVGEFLRAWRSLS